MDIRNKRINRYTDKMIDTIRSVSKDFLNSPSETILNAATCILVVGAPISIIYSSVNVILKDMNRINYYEIPEYVECVKNKGRLYGTFNAESYCKEDLW